MNVELGQSYVGILCLVIFIAGYVAVSLEEKLALEKSKPALFVGTLSFLFLGVAELIIYGEASQTLHHAFVNVIVEIAEIFFFLYVAMIYVEALTERNVFEAFKSKLLKRELSYRKLLWLMGGFTFAISAVADNLTTALIFATLAKTMAPNDKKFLAASAVNIVVASNAGGAFSPFGDVTTLMIWNAGKADFFEFLALFPASLAGWAVTCYLISKTLPLQMVSTKDIDTQMKPGGAAIVYLGLATIAVAVLTHQLLHLPAILGMVFGLSLLMIYTYSMRRKAVEHVSIFDTISKIENDALLFFFGLMCGVGALSYIGYLAIVGSMYNGIDHMVLNICMGFLSALIDNVPLTYALLKADPQMSHEQWMLLTLAVGTGGSLIAFGSAAGVAVMGKLKGIYTFSTHIRYFPFVLTGYLVSIVIWWVQF